MGGGKTSGSFQVLRSTSLLLSIVFKLTLTLPLLHSQLPIPPPLSPSKLNGNIKLSTSSEKTTPFIWTFCNTGFYLVFVPQSLFIFVPCCFKSSSWLFFFPSTQGLKFLDYSLFYSCLQINWSFPKLIPLLNTLPGQ